MKKKIFISLLAICLLLVSCFKDNDDTIGVASTLTIQDFIYRGLNFFYLYKADTPELANDAFTTQSDLNNFLNNYDTPEDLFNYLKSNQDRFSILFSDYTVIEDVLNGITLNNGMEYGLVFYPDDSGNVFGYVRYVLPNTSAEAAGIQRGDIFNTVGGTQITEENFNALLSPDSYSIGLATFDGITITPTGETAQLTKTQYTENPIYLTTTLDIQGRKVGYIMYNAFTSSFDPQLNASFAQFQADGVNDLVLDLRYNGGGSVSTAKSLSSMITGQFNGQLYYTEIWNADRQADYAEDAFFENTLSNGQPINSLNLPRVYILTSKRTASASELVINTLDPYINVVQVGENTTGKFQASFLLYDAPAPNFNRSQANPNHTYAMLPLVFKTANSVGFTDFVDGLIPDVRLREDYSNLGQLGDPNEPLLAAALNEIFPTNRPINLDFPVLEEISDSKATSPIDEIMVAENKSN